MNAFISNALRYDYPHPLRYNMSDITARERGKYTTGQTRAHVWMWVGGYAPKQTSIYRKVTLHLYQIRNQNTRNFNKDGDHRTRQRNFKESSHTHLNIPYRVAPLGSYLDILYKLHIRLTSLYNSQFMRP